MGPDRTTPTHRSRHAEFRHSWPLILLIWIVLVLAAFVLVMGVVVTLRDYPRPATCPDVISIAPQTWCEAGERGDFWGGHLAATSGVAASLLLLGALLLQWRDLRFTQQQMYETRIANEDQARAQAAVHLLDEIDYRYAKLPAVTLNAEGRTGRRTHRYACVRTGAAAIRAGVPSRRCRPFAYADIVSGKRRVRSPRRLRNARDVRAEIRRRVGQPDDFGFKLKLLAFREQSRSPCTEEFLLADRLTLELQRLGFR